MIHIRTVEFQASVYLRVRRVLAHNPPHVVLSKLRKETATQHINNLIIQFLNSCSKETEEQHRQKKAVRF